MKSSHYTSYGTEEVLSIIEKAKPSPKPDQILVKVHATTVNRTDCAMLTAKPWIMRLLCGLFSPRKSVLGTDFSGEVVEIGTKVSRFKVGDKIFGFNDMGLASHAEYLVIPEKQAIEIIPEGVTYEDAAASAEGAHYAYNFINKLQPVPGQTAMVNGASGAIGSALAQLLIDRGVKVTITTKSDYVGDFSAWTVEKIIDYTSEDFTMLGTKFDYVLDAVGKSTFGKCKKLLKPGGVYMSSELGPWGQNLFYGLLRPLTGKYNVVFPFPVKPQESLSVMAGMLRNGTYAPLIDQHFPLDDASQAFSYILKGQKKGNVILKIHDGK